MEIALLISADQAILNTFAVLISSLFPVPNRSECSAVPALLCAIKIIRTSERTMGSAFQIRFSNRRKLRLLDPNFWIRSACLQRASRLADGSDLEL